MALQAVDLGANKEAEEAPLQNSDGDRPRPTQYTYWPRLQSEVGQREGAREETDERAEHFVDSLARRGTQVLDRRASVCLPQFGEAKGNFFVAFVALATVLFLFCCPAIP